MPLVPEARFTSHSTLGVPQVSGLKVFEALVLEPGLEWVFIDGSYAKAHQHSVGAAGGQELAIGKSRAGNTSKIHQAVDAFRWSVAFEITGGQTHHCAQVSALIEQLPNGQAFIGDKGHDSQTIRECIERQGAKAVIPRRRNSAKGNADFDKGLYRYRHLVENPFAHLKHFRAVATRFDKFKAKLSRQRRHGLRLHVAAYMEWEHALVSVTGFTFCHLAQLTARACQST